MRYKTSLSSIRLLSSTSDTRIQHNQSLSHQKLNIAKQLWPLGKGPLTRLTHQPLTGSSIWAKATSPPFHSLLLGLQHQAISLPYWCYMMEPYIGLITTMLHDAFMAPVVLLWSYFIWKSLSFYATNGISLWAFSWFPQSGKVVEKVSGHGTSWKCHGKS